MAGIEQSAWSDLPPLPNPWTATNLVGIPPGLIGSAQFHRHPLPLRIAGTRETHPGLFALLERCATQQEAAEVFAHYMSIVFGLARPPRGTNDLEHRRWCSSYVKLLQGWGFDSNGPQGAVLKGWVESRFGLMPTYHKLALARFPSAAWIGYIEEKMVSRFHNNSINLQLDLLYEYCQWSLARHAPFGPTYVRLWRGSNGCEEQIVEGSLKTRRDRRQRCVMRMNNLVSFSLSRDRAQEFGDWCIEADVPLVKLLFFPGLLADAVLNGEGEALVLGGDFEVRARYG